MASIFRVKAEWTGFAGAPGISVFHFSTFEGNFGPGAQGAINALVNLFDGINSLIPDNITIRVSDEVEVIEDSTGELIDYVPGLTTAPSQGANTATYAGPSGAVINWSTSTVRNGRRMRGRTFLVPLSIGAYDQDGTLTSGAVTTLQTEVDLLLAAPDVELLVYGRPTAAGTDGVSAPVISGRVPDLVAVLRSRRD